MLQRLQSVITALQEQQALMLVMILDSSGSTPRGAGALMLVFEDSHTEGTIGGGAVEHAAIVHAGELLEQRCSDTVIYRLNTDDVVNLGMICGGDVTVHFQYLEGERYLPLFLKLKEDAVENTGAWLVRRIENKTVTAMTVCGSATEVCGDEPDREILPKLLSSRPVYLEGEISWYAEPVVKAGTVYVFGGGHVSREVVPLLARVGFSVAVYEDREIFADTALFPDACRVILGDFNHIEEHVSLTEYDYVVIMTRGHQADFEVLSQALKAPCTYIGCIGSRKKITITKRRILDLGFDETDFERVHAPIGLPIRAETPEEIAVSVAAELILHRAQNQIA